MKLVSTLALGAALALSSAVAPALAQKKAAAAPAAPNYKLSKEFRAALAPAQPAIKAGNTAAAVAALAAAEALVKTPDEKYIAAAVRLELASAAKDPAMQGRAIEGMIASGSAPTADLPKLHYYAGSLAYQRNDFVNANRFLAQAHQLGYAGSDLYLLLAESNFKSNQVPAGLAFVDKAVAAKRAANEKAPEDWYRRAASVAYKAKLMPESSRWTREQVRAYPSADNWRSALVIYRDSGQRDGQLNLDLFRLMRATKSLDGERDYYEYAALATERGLPGEAKAVIEEGLASGKVPSSSRAITEMRTMASGKISADRASLATSERQAAGAATGKIAANTGDAYLGYGDDAKAIALYRAALTKGGVDTDAVNTRLGIALARSGDKAGARAAFAAVKGTRQEIAQFWMLYIDQATT